MVITLILKVLISCCRVNITVVVSFYKSIFSCMFLNFLLIQQKTGDHVDVWSPIKNVCFQNKFQCNLHCGKNWVPLLLPNTWDDCFEQSTAQPIFNDKNRGCQKIGECFYGWGTRIEKNMNFLQIKELCLNCKVLLLLYKTSWDLAK